MAALQEAAGLTWSSKARVLLLIADAPAHGRDCNDDKEDRHPYGSPRSGCDVWRVMKHLVRREVELIVLPVQQGKLDKTLSKMREYYNNASVRRELTAKPLFDSRTLPVHAYHFVLCLDCSYSMETECDRGCTRWEALMRAYRKLLRQRIAGQCTGDLVSVVTFSASPNVEFQLAPVTRARQKLQCSSAGTAFGPALEACGPLLGNTPDGHTPVLIFMSDGEDQSGTAMDKMKQLWQLHSGRGLKVHTIAFGCSEGLQLLKDMAAAAGGHYHEAMTGLDLGATFERIAAGCTIMDSMVATFSNKLSEMITTRITLDHL
jgi:Mg-chelatase subunit ChlD